MKVGDSWLPRQPVDAVEPHHLPDNAPPRHDGSDRVPQDGGSRSAGQRGTRIVLRAFRFDAFSGLSVADMPPGMEDREVCRLHEYEIVVPRGSGEVAGAKRGSGLGQSFHLAGRQEGKGGWRGRDEGTSDKPAAILVHEKCIEEVSV